MNLTVSRFFHQSPSFKTSFPWHYANFVTVRCIDWQKNGDMDGYVGFHAALRRSYISFVNDLSKHCKQLVRHHLDSVTSPYSQVCYEPDLTGGIGSGSNSYSRANQLQSISYFLDLSDSTGAQEEMDQENIPPKDQQNTTPGKKMESREEALKESQMTIPETPSPDMPIDAVLGVRKKDNGNCLDIPGRKRQARTVTNGRIPDAATRNQSFGLVLGDLAKTGSSYADICSLAAQHFARIREVLIERSVSSALNSGFLTPWYDLKPVNQLSVIIFVIIILLIQT